MRYGAIGHGSVLLSRCSIQVGKRELFRVEGIPKSFIYSRDGSLVAQAIDMRTQGQFLAMLAQAGPAIRGSLMGLF